MPANHASRPDDLPFIGSYGGENQPPNRPIRRSEMMGLHEQVAQRWPEAAEYFSGLLHELAWMRRYLIAACAYVPTALVKGPDDPSWPDWLIWVGDEVRAHGMAFEAGARPPHPALTADPANAQIPDAMLLATAEATAVAAFEAKMKAYRDGLAENLRELFDLGELLIGWPREEDGKTLVREVPVGIHGLSRPDASRLEKAGAITWHGDKARLTLRGQTGGQLFAAACGALMEEDNEPRTPGCECHVEEGDSPCPVHGDEEGGGE